VSALWVRHPRLLGLVALAARVPLGIGKLRLSGLTPTGTRFLGSPQALWLVRASRATVGGLDVGPSNRLQRGLALGDFRIPRRGLFAISHLFMTSEPRP